MQGLRVPARRATNRRREPRRSRQTQGLARPLGRYARENALYQIEAARALRAFARASLGYGEGARRDIAAVRARAGVSAESPARVSLAEAIVLERSGGRDALRALLDRDKGLLLESCHPRERAIVRAYQRMVRVTTTTAYRAAPPREEEDHRGDEPLLLDRVTRIAPGAAAFVRAPRAHTGPVGPRVEMLPEARAGAHRDLLRSRADTAAAVGKRSNRLRLLAAVRGELDAASAALAGLEVREDDRLAAHASALQATIAERRCDAEAMLEAASTGLGRLGRVDAPEAAMLQPELVAQRAFALTLLDRGAEAAAELTVLAQRTAPMRERDLFRVRLIGLARAGKLVEAARWVEQESGDLPLGVRDELLADLVRAAAAPESAGLGEVERLEHELRTEPEIRRWIEWVAPRVLHAFRSANEGDPAAEAIAARPLRVGAVDAEDPRRRRNKGGIIRNEAAGSVASLDHEDPFPCSIRPRRCGAPAGWLWQRGRRSAQQREQQRQRGRHDGGWGRGSGERRRERPQHRGNWRKRWERRSGRLLRHGLEPGLCDQLRRCGHRCGRRRRLQHLHHRNL